MGINWNEIIVIIRDPGYSTFGLFVVTLLLFFATRSLARSAKLTSQYQLRAYVAINSGAIQLVEENPTSTLRLSVSVKNAGVTPAYSFQTWIKAEVGEQDMSPAFLKPPQKLERPNSILGPGQEAHLGCIIRISAEQLIALRSGQLRVFILGRADYRDIFGRKRFFHFRSANNGDFSASVSGIGPYGRGYEAN